MKFLFLTLAINTLVAQVRATPEVAFDLDKRSIGTLPFDERFKLTAFDTKLDKPGKVTHLRRMKLTRVNELPRFDLSLG